MQTYGDERFLRLMWEVNWENGWTPISKGGDYETFYFPTHLLMNYKDNGKECGAVNYMDNGQIAQTRRNSSLYYRSGLSYPNKSTKGFSVRQQHEGSLFTIKGPVIIPNDDSLKLYLLGWVNSKLIRSLVHRQANTGEYLAGIIQKLPWAEPSKKVLSIVTKCVSEIINMKLSIYALNEYDSHFCKPWLTPDPPTEIEDMAIKIDNHISSSNDTVSELISKIDYEICNLYECVDIDFEDYGVEIQDHNIQIKPFSYSESAQNIISYLIGLSFGHWPLQYFSDAIKSEDNVFECLKKSFNLGLKFYPSILCDDTHFEFCIYSKIKDVIEIIWKDKAIDFYSELDSCLDRVENYLPHRFFGYHLKQYSKSRRQSPIYWPLQIPSGSFTLWIYYHRLTEKTLYKCVNDFVEPKLKIIKNDLDGLYEITARNSSEEKELTKLTDLQTELKDFRDELLRIAKFWKPNLNDGVQITAAPLWKLFQHKQWQKKLTETWEKLEKGEYDWAHLACSIWPERVLRKCHEDRSLAIAHDVEDDFWEEVEVPIIRRGKDTGKTKIEWHPKAFTEVQLKDLIQQKIEEMNTTH